MDIYEELFSEDGNLIERIAAQIFETLTDDGPLVIFLDHRGNIWPSSSDALRRTGLNETTIQMMCRRIDDGDEPLMTQADGFSVLAKQLVTERTKYGYAILVLPQYTPESTFLSVDLIEMFFNMVELVASLIEKNHSLYELRTKTINLCNQTAFALN